MLAGSEQLYSIDAGGVHRAYGALFLILPRSSWRRESSIWWLGLARRGGVWAKEVTKGPMWVGPGGMLRRLAWPVWSRDSPAAWRQASGKGAQ